MSFILEQLKKSGKKRELELAMRSRAAQRHGASAGMARTFEEPAPATGMHRRGVALSLLLAAVLCSMLGGYALFRSKDPARQGPVAVREAQVPAAATSAPLAGNTEPRSAPPIVAEDSPAPRARSKAEPQKLSPEPAAAKKIPAAKITKPLPAATYAGRGGQAPSTSDHRQTAAPSLQEKPGQQDHDRGLPYLADLPAPLKKALPPIHITSHLYRGNSRLVSINGRIMSQGVALDDGLFLEEITAEGVILSFHGQRFRVRAD